MEVRIPIGVSNRHIHLTKEDFTTLFGNIEPTPLFFLSGSTTYFATNETVNVYNDKHRINDVRIIMPFYKESSLEILMADSLALFGYVIPRGKKMHDVYVEGPKGTILLKDAVCRSVVHLHVNPIDADWYPLKKHYRLDINNEIIDVLENKLTDIGTTIHIDKDDAEELGVTKDTIGRLLYDFTRQ